jgi:ABC-type transport system involved in multi-copper enzyme maturation permease subunit
MRPALVSRIAQLEFRLLFAQGMTWVLLATFASMIVFAVWNGARTIQDREASLGAFTASERINLLHQKEESRAVLRELANGIQPKAYWNATKPGQAAFFAQLSAIQPLPTTAVLALGEIDIAPGAYVALSPGRTVPESIPSAPQTANPLKTLLGSVDLLFVVIYFAPLVVLGLCYGLMSEKETGILPSLLAQPVRLFTLVMTKVAVRTIVFATTGLGATLASIAMFRPDLFSLAWRATLLAWISGAALYSLFWFAIGVFVNGSGRSSTAVGLAMGGIWLVLVFLSPPLCKFFARIARPVPSRTVVIDAKRNAVLVTGGHQIGELAKESKDPESPARQLVRAYFAKHPELDPSRPSDDERSRLIFFLEMLEAGRLAAPVENQWMAARDKQMQLIRNLQFLLPASILESALTNLAGTSAEQHDWFLSQVEQHRLVWMDFVLGKYARGELLDASAYDHLPQFSYKQEPEPDFRNRVFARLGALGIVTLGLVVAAVWRYRRYAIAG